MLTVPLSHYPESMYEDFHVTDRWTGEDLHCRWKANIVAIATRHADAVDIRFDVNNRPMWIALPCLAWVEQKKRTGKVITDYLAAQLSPAALRKTATDELVSLVPMLRRLPRRLLYYLIA